MARASSWIAPAAALLCLISASSHSQEAAAPSAAEKEALAIARRATQLYDLRKHAEAEEQWRIVCNDYSKTSQYGAAQFNLGYVIQKQGKYEAAIEEYQKLIGSRVNDREPTTNIMEMFRNYHRRTANAISQCYEKQGKFADALDWAVRARDQYPY